MMKGKKSKEKMEKKLTTITAFQEYAKLKKSNFSDGEIRKIAQIILACAMETNRN